MNVKGLLTLALLGMSSLASAQNATPLHRWELGGELGVTEHSLSHSSDRHKIDEQDVGTRVFASYYFTPSVAFRLGYADLGEVEWYSDSYYEDFTSTRLNELSARSSATAVTFGGVFTLPIDRSPVTFALELGFLNWDVEYQVTDSRTPDGGATTTQVTTFDSTNLGFYGGGNVSYQFTPQFAVGASLLWYAMEPEINGDDQFDLLVQALNLAAVIRF